MACLGLSDGTRPCPGRPEGDMDPSLGDMVLPWSQEEGSECQGLTLADGSQEAAPGTVTVRKTGMGTERNRKRPVQTEKESEEEQVGAPGSCRARVCAPTCPLPSSPHGDDLKQPPGVGQPSLVHTEEA